MSSHVTFKLYSCLKYNWIRPKSTSLPVRFSYLQSPDVPLLSLGSQSVWVAQCGIYNKERIYTCTESKYQR